MSFLNPSYVFALGAGCLVVSRILYSTMKNLYQRPLQAISKAYLFYLKYPTIISRGRWAGPISREELMLQLLHTASTVAFNGIGVKSIKQAGARAATLSVIHLIPLFFGTHLSFAADILGFSLRTYRIMHRSIGVSAFILGLFHVLVVIAQGPRLVVDRFILSGIVVSSFQKKAQLAI